VAPATNQGILCREDPRAGMLMRSLSRDLILLGYDAM